MNFVTEGSATSAVTASGRNEMLFMGFNQDYGCFAVGKVVNMMMMMMMMMLTEVTLSLSHSLSLSLSICVIAFTSMSIIHFHLPPSMHQSVYVYLSM